MVGDEGQIYLSGLPLKGKLLIQWGNGKGIAVLRTLFSAGREPEAGCCNGNRHLFIGYENEIKRLSGGARAAGCAVPAHATVCRNANGVPAEDLLDLSNTFNSSNNQVGQIVTLAEKSQWVGVNATCPSGTSGNTTMRSYVTTLPVQETLDGYLSEDK